MIEAEEKERFLVLLNNTGDVCISWEESQDIEMLTYIQKKIDAGYIFFVADRTAFNLFKRKKLIKSVNELTDERKVYLDDAEAEQMAKDGKIQISKVNASKVATIQKAKTAPEVINSGASIAVRPARGG